MIHHTHLTTLPRTPTHIPLLNYKRRHEQYLEWCSVGKLMSGGLSRGCSGTRGGQKGLVSVWCFLLHPTPKFLDPFLTIRAVVEDIWIELRCGIILLIFVTLSALVMFYTKYEDSDNKSKSQSGVGNMKGLSKLFQTQFDNTEWE